MVSFSGQLATTNRYIDLPDFKSMAAQLAEQPKEGRTPFVIGLGESLFDCFADRRVLGGAPLNVAVHTNALLKPLGGSAMPVTRVGTDSLGDEVIESLRARNLRIDGVQRDPKHATGRVQVSVDEAGVASYNFETDSAWDHIEYGDTLAQLARRCDAVAFGTLAQRTEVSGQAVRQFLSDASTAIRLFDVNLRQDFYSQKILEQSLRLATALKVNEEELEILAELLEDGSDSIPSTAERLRRTFDLAWVAVTRGPKGVAMATAEGWIEGGEPAPHTDSEPNADTVGAGDACCAGLLTGTLLRWTPERTLDFANRTGSYVASCAGATPALPDEIIDQVSAS